MFFYITMNLEYEETRPPLRVLVVNPLTLAGRLIIIKILSGSVFGLNQMVELTLLIYVDEKKECEDFVLELENCCLPLCASSVKISTDTPTLEDADVFVIETTFKNPNIFNVEEGLENEENASTLYTLLKVATYLKWPQHPELVKRKPLIICDGLVTMDIMYTFSSGIPSKCFFCPTPVAAIARSLLGDHLKVLSNTINNIHVFGANDQDFYFEFENPLIVDIKCKINFDSTHISDSFLRKELQKKVKEVASKNLYGPIFKSMRFKFVTHVAWRLRADKSKKDFRSIGVISDGSFDTIKGLPYVLPIKFTDNEWKADTTFEDDYNVKYEIQRFNKIVRDSHTKLVSFCKKFYKQNFIYDTLSTNSMPTPLRTKSWVPATSNSGFGSKVSAHTASIRPTMYSQKDPDCVDSSVRVRWNAATYN